ncbi:MAG: hypothetical protein OEM99_11150 [Gammaproteobacteria bacterium]|nr:hypothetical protein [Gammaproteobacteria bacterium]
MENIRQIPWRRTMVESVAIILSILLAFAIDAGWDTFKEHNQEKAFLASLLDDFEETRSRIDASTDRHMIFIDFARQLLEFHGGDAPDIETDALETMLGAVFFDWTSLYLPSGSRDALFSSGDIEIISNEELRAMLAAWPSVVADAAEDDIWIANDVMYNMAPYLHGKIRTRNVARFTSSDAAERIPHIESVDYDALWNDRMFDNIVSFRILSETYALSENERLSEAVNGIIRAIEKELKR